MSVSLPAARGTRDQLLTRGRFLTVICGVMLVYMATLFTPGSVMAQEPEGFRDAIGLLHAWTENRVATRGEPGLSIGVVLGDRLIWARGYGFADLEKKTPATPQTLFRIGSITKSFTAVSILQLRDAGKLQLDDTLKSHLRDVQIRPHSKNSTDVTLRELLTHTSGLQREIPGTVVTDAIWPSEANLRLALNEPYDPDTQWKYSNLGFALLGKVVATEGGQPWDKYVQAHIVAPLGMTATRVIPRADEPGLSIGYVRTVPGSTFVPAAFFPSGPGDPAAAIATNVEDLAKYLAFHMAEGQNNDSLVLSGQSLREMHRPQWLLPDWQNAWGFGLRVRRIDGIVRVGHGGAVPGHTSYIEFAPALKFGVIVLTNSNDGDPVSYVDYAMQLLAPVVAKSITHEPKKVGEDLRPYEGTYQSKDYRVWLVTVLNGQLSMVAPDASNPYTVRTILEATNERHVFTMRSEGYATGPFGENLTFDVAGDGTVTGFHTENMRFSRVAILTTH